MKSVALVLQEAPRSNARRLVYLVCMTEEVEEVEWSMCLCSRCVDEYTECTGIYVIVVDGTVDRTGVSTAHALLQVILNYMGGSL